MSDINWAAKLTQRKFWMALCGLVSGLLLCFRVDQTNIDQITGVIMAAASVVAYIIGEGLADAASAKGDVYEGDVYINGVEDDPIDDEMED